MSNMSIKHLNELLKGEEMAVDAYQNFKQDSYAKNIQDTFHDIQRDHHRHFQHLSNRIIELGGTPDYGTGLVGVMADITHTLQQLPIRDSLELLRSAYDGEDQGIAAAEKIAREGLDDESQRLVSQMFREDHDHLKKLKDLIGMYEFKQ